MLTSNRLAIDAFESGGKLSDHNALCRIAHLHKVYETHSLAQPYINLFKIFLWEERIHSMFQLSKLQNFTRVAYSTFVPR